MSLATISQCLQILQILLSTLEKRFNAIAYHFVCQGVARNEWRTAYINTMTILRICLPNGWLARSKRVCENDITSYLSSGEFRWRRRGLSWTQGSSDMFDGT